MLRIYKNIIQSAEKQDIKTFNKLMTLFKYYNIAKGVMYATIFYGIILLIFI